MKRVHYSMYGAAVRYGITENARDQMEKLGYKIVSGRICAGYEEAIYEV